MPGLDAKTGARISGLSNLRPGPRRNLRYASRPLRLSTWRRGPHRARRGGRHGDPRGPAPAHGGAELSEQERRRELQSARVRGLQPAPDAGRGEHRLAHRGGRWHGHRRRSSSRDTHGAHLLSHCGAATDFRLRWARYGHPCRRKFLRFSRNSCWRLSGRQIASGDRNETRLGHG